MNFAKDLVSEQEALIKALSARQQENKVVKKLGSDIASRMDSLKNQLKVYSTYYIIIFYKYSIIFYTYLPLQKIGPIVFICMIHKILFLKYYQRFIMMTIQSIK